MAERVRAIIVKDGKIILIKRTKPNSTYWVFPGGRVEAGETKQQALVREVKEELGLDIAVKDLLTSLPSAHPEMLDTTEYFFIAEIIGGQLGFGTGPEYQHESNYLGSYKLEWVEISELSKIDLRPVEVRDLVIEKYGDK